MQNTHDEYNEECEENMYEDGICTCELAYSISTRQGQKIGYGEANQYDGGVSGTAQRLTAVARPANSGEDYRGWVITVMADEDTLQRCRIDLPDWTNFRPASAGHRLIEHGYIVQSPAHFEPERMAGWLRSRVHGAYSAPVWPLDGHGRPQLVDEGLNALDVDAAATVHYTDPRVRQLAEARWRTSTGRSRDEWLALGKDNPEAMIEEARDWIRAAVAASIIPPPTETTPRP